MRNSEIKAALRTFYREKSYALINLSGLSLAIACCFILCLYLRSELTYDQHHKKHKQIFRVVNSFSTDGSPNDYAVTSPALGPLLIESYPEIKAYVKFAHNDKLMIRSGDKALFWDDAYSASENVFDVFTHEIIYGDPKTALKDPSSAAVSETFARKYFGDANPVGKTIQAELVPDIPRKITLVFRDLPENTHLKYSVLFHMDELPSTMDRRQLLYRLGLYTYVVLPENYNIKNWKTISDSFFNRYMKDLGKQLNQTWRSWLEPLADIHLHSDLPYDLPKGNRYYIYGFAAVAAFILLVACINYVNLAIARAAKRSKEIGMRKILGVPKLNLIFRFLSEAILFGLIAMFFGAVLVELALKLTPINELFGKPLAGLMDEPILFLWMLGLSLLTGLLSGLYPAFYLSSISPLSALTSSRGGGKGSFRLRELLVLTQFTVSFIVIACALVMAMQMRYLSKKPLGFEKDNRVIVNMKGLDLIEKYPVIKNELLKDSHISGISVSQIVLGSGNISVTLPMVDNDKGVLERKAMCFMAVGDDFLEVMGMPLASGRDFSKKLLTDVGASFVVNETFVKSMGWNNPLGKRIQQLAQMNGRVIGVAKDFHFKSLHSRLEPLILHQFNDDFQNIPPAVRPAIQRTMIIKISGSNVQQTLHSLQSKFAQYDPKHPFEYQFLDDFLNKIYLSEERLMKMVGIFSGICIFISCLGLFGLAAFTTEQRSKEIGVRKVLGASASQIIIMLARKILWLVLAGSVVASIIAYLVVDEWLTSFAYRVGIHPLVFVGSAIIVIAVAFATIALQSYKAAQTNPAQTLRYE